MYVDISKSRGKYVRYLLRQSFRDGGKVRHRTVANLSGCTPEEIQAIRIALKYKKHLAGMAAAADLPINGLNRLPGSIRTPHVACSTLDEVMERKYLRAGVHTHLIPFGYIDECGKHAGFEIDLVAQIACRLGVGCELVPVTSATRIPFLIQGRIDLVAATMTHYRRRDAVIDFSIGYFRSPQAVMVKKGRRIDTLCDLFGHHAGATEGSAGADSVMIFNPRGRVKTFPTHPAVFQSLQEDAIDAFVADWVILACLRSWAGSFDEFHILPKEGRLSGGPYGIGVPENDSRWRDRINALLQDIWEDGTWDALFNKWFGPSTPLNLKKEDLCFQMPLWQ